MIKYNLQFFAKDGPGGQRTEPATAKKLKDARKKGQVAKSRDLTSSVSLLVFFPDPVLRNLCYFPADSAGIYDLQQLL